MPASLIAETPVLTWSALGDQEVTVTLTPRDGTGLDDYGTFTLTIREDPEWPRSGPDKAAAASADPLADGWPVAASDTSTAGALDTEVNFTITVPEGAGYRRYAVDCVADGGSVGRVQVVRPIWLTVGPTLLAGS